MSIPDLSTKRKIRVVDCCVRNVCMFANAGSGMPAGNYGFLIQTGSLPVCILCCDIRMAASSSYANTYVYEVSSCGTSATFTAYDTLGPNPLAQVVSVTGGTLTSIMNTPQLQNVESSTWTSTIRDAYELNGIQLANAGRFRKGGRLLKPNTKYVMFINTTDASTNVMRQLQGYLEWIEGDFDYSEIMRIGRTWDGR